ncbi:MAG: amino acid permease [Phycisphaerales bacterium]
MPQTADSAAEPRRVLGESDATCIVVGAIIGVGIFFSPARTAALTGSGSLHLLTWIIAGAIILCGALAFAELGGMYHRSGAQYEVLRDAWGPMPAFLFVFCNATAIQAGAIGVIAVICAQNLGVAAGSGAPEGAPLLALSAALVVAITLANIAGVRWGSGIQNATVAAKVLALVAIAVIAALWGQADPMAAAPALPVAIPDGAAAVPATDTAQPLAPAAAILAALVPAFFAFGGWQHALWITGEVKDPARTVPRAIIVGIIVVIAVYLLANWAYLRLLGVQQVAASKTLAADAVSAVFPGTGRRLTAAAVAVSAFGVLNAQLLSGPRLVYGMAHDGRFFPVFARLSRTGTPLGAIVLLGVLALALLFGARDADRVDWLTTWAVFLDGIFFALTGAAVLILRRKRRDAERPFRVPGYPVVPLLFIAGEIGVLTGAFLTQDVRSVTVIGGAWIAGAALIYLIWFRNVGRTA